MSKLEVCTKYIKDGKKKMSERVIGFLYCRSAISEVGSTPKQIVADFVRAGLGKPSGTRIRDVLARDRRTKKINTNEWILKSDFFNDVERDFEINMKASNKIIKKEDRKKIFYKYDLHPRIKQVSYRQFESGFYKEAIQNAFVEVIDQVKMKSGNPSMQKNERTITYDGESLMNHVFGCDGKTPLIKFNSLGNSLEKAEQRGIMNLYKGIVGIRDKKAHMNFIQNDPIKSLEYLSLASLLLRLLDEYS